MPDGVDIRQSPQTERIRRFAAVAGVLLLLIPLTWLAQSWYVSELSDSAPAVQQEAVARALGQIESRFDDMQQDLLDRAREIARDPVVMQSLRTRARQGLSEGPEEVVDLFAGLDVPLHTSVELYDFSPQLVAWHGFSMPLDAAPSSPRFLDAFQTAIATDGNVRQALVVWRPVREGTRVLGAVRAMRLIGFDAPVRNEYLRDFSLGDRWQRLTDLPVSVSFDLSAASTDPTVRSRLLQGADGTTLGRVSIYPPSREELLESASARFDDVTAFWLVLLMFWAVGGLWYAYQSKLVDLPEKPRGKTLGWLASWFVLVSAAWWSIRFALLNLEVPGRWQGGKAPLAPLFDPMHFASGFGGGLMRSTGDFLLTGIFFLVFAIAFVDLTRSFKDRSAYLFELRERLRRRRSTTTQSVFVAVGAVAAGTLTILGLTILLALATRRVVLDSTFDFYARKGLLPEPLLLLVFCALILVTIGVLLLAIGVVWITSSVALRRLPDEMSTWTFWLTILLAVALPLAVLYTALPLNDVVAWPVSLSFVAVAFTLAVFLILRRQALVELFILRSILPSIFLVTVLLYPMLYNGMDASRRIQMLDAAETFSEGRDPRVLFALEQLLREIRMNDAARDVLQEGGGAPLDSLANEFFQRSFLSSLPAYDVTLTFFSRDQEPIGRYHDTGRSLDAQALRQLEPLQANILYEMYQEGDRSVGVMVAPITGVREPDRLQYGGIAPVYASGTTDVIGWVTVRAEPESALREGGTPFPRVLLPSGSYDDLYTNVAIAEFRDGVLVRTMGRDFGRYRLPEDVRQALAAESSIWRTEEVEERDYQTYYHRRERTIERDAAAAILPSTVMSIVGVRVPSINTFDHLYYLLRLTVAGLLIGLPLYLFGLYLRRRAGMLPAPRVRFRDKVLNAFLGVGIISVAAVGFVGLEVVTGENERAVQSWLRQHLERVEETLNLDTRDEQMPYTVLDRVSIDSLAGRVGLDLNVYRGYSLAKLSRPQLVRERLIDQRLPIEAYDALFFDGYRFVYTNEHVGDFTYTTGFRALPDEQGRPRFVVSVPTLPEQERIEEERARTVAYLFGSLLLLLLVVMFTASLLANAISRPIARLRSGLQAVAAGRFERMIPVDSRDEIGELVQTFNEMQEQLVDSRRKLAQQERQLAWREMARQVAHEIKNPLTPMKLSVQHLRRAFRSDGADDPEKARKFETIFDRITTTLIEQIDTLARIANEFHSFARMPSRILDKVDLNAIVDQAVSLMQEESDIEITLDLHPRPMIIEADREELRRIYINVIKNAIQAIPEDQKGRVDVRTEFEQPNFAASSITDNGTGIAPDVQDRIFEPNFSTKTSGTGLGLAIAKKGVEEMGGEIGFETEEEKGTTVWIRLPIVHEPARPMTR